MLKINIKVDTLIIEDANIGSSRLPLTPNDALNVMGRLAENHKQVIATTHALDLEYAYALMKIAAKFNRDFYVATTQTAKLIEKVQEMSVKLKLVEEYVDYLTPLKKVTLEEIGKEAFVLVSYAEIIDFLNSLKSIDTLTDVVVVISEPEPQIEEASGYDIITNWLSKMGVQSYGIRASGHYYRYQLKTILKTIKPRRHIKAIHTQNAEFFQLMMNTN